MASIAVSAEVLDGHLVFRVPLAALPSLLVAPPPPTPAAPAALPAPGGPAGFTMDLKPLPGGFDWSWPSGRNHYGDAFSGRVSWNKRAYDVRGGRIQLPSAGRPRYYWLIVVNGYPTLHFVEGEDGRYASLITLAGSRASARTDADIPPAYFEAGLTFGDYHEVIRGPGVTRGRAVVIDSPDDRGPMVRHAILRWEGRQAAAAAAGKQADAEAEADVEP